MDGLSGDISAMIFKHTDSEQQDDFSIDSRLLKVFLEFDGKKNVGKVAQKLGAEANKLKPIISKLMGLNLIELDRAAGSFLDKVFIDYLNSQLTLALGPIADVLIEDEAAEMGYEISKFPSAHAAELVDILAREIRREEKITQFKLNMVNKIREKGY